MASRTAILAVRIIADAKGMTEGLKAATGGLDKWEERTKSAAQKMTVASAGVLAFGKAGVDAAANLEQSMGAVDAVFENSAGMMKKFANTAAETVGLSANEYNEFATVIGSQLKNLGIPMEQVGNKTNELVELGADLASMYGGTTADAVSALSAVFRGETDPIEKYGVSIKQSDVNARIAADGLDGLEGAARKQAEAETRLKLVTEQTAAAHGNFAREVDTVQHKQQVATAKWEDAKAKLGAGLLPVVAAVTDKLAVFAEWLGKHPQLVAVFGSAILGVTGALWTAWAAMKAWSTVQSTIKGVQTAWSVMSKAMGASSATAEAASKGGALRAAGAWIASAARSTAAWVAMAARTVAHFVAVAAAAVAHGVAAAAQWVASAARSTAAWVAAQARIVAGYAVIAAQATMQAMRAAAVWIAQNARAAASFLLLNAKMLIVRGATLAMAAAQGVLNAVMSMNPIMLVVIAITALVAGLVLAYQKCDWFRNIVQQVGAVASAAFSGVVNWVKNLINGVGNLIGRAGGIGGVFRSAGNVAKAAIRAITIPITWLIDKVKQLINWIGRIRFPSPPGWAKKLFGRSAAPAAEAQRLQPAAAFAARSLMLRAEPVQTVQTVEPVAMRATSTGLVGAMQKMADMIGEGTSASKNSNQTVIVNVNVSGAVVASKYELANVVTDALKSKGFIDGTAVGVRR